ncbi:MAG: helix-turn-helix transcriptional regulator, partial [Bacteroidota bacterium]|nr:helix-turn-helix transcriptional regulator [Bacteroidota bacterium]
MEDNPQINNEQTILLAAHKIFKMKGFDNATVQEIADMAGTTKSMVNYYFRTKEKLFASIFHQEFVNFLSGIVGFISSDLPLATKIEKIVEM